jgi:hypothetical protein
MESRNTIYPRRRLLGRCRGRCPLVLMVGLSIAIAANVLFAGLAGIFMTHFTVSNLDRTIPQHPRASDDHPVPRPRQVTLPPRDSSVNTAGFIHMGKTGGSTISKLIRNGCSSFTEGSCHNITNETVISRFVVSFPLPSQLTNSLSGDDLLCLFSDSQLSLFSPMP